MALCRVIEMLDGSVRVMHPIGAENDEDARAILDRDQALHEDLDGRPFIDIDPSDLPDRESRAQWGLTDGEIVVAEAPDPEPTRAERVDALVAEGVAALATATTLSQVKAVFAAALTGLGAIDGTGGAA